MNIMNAIMLSCVKATQLMEIKEGAPFGFIKIMPLQMHTATCSGCRNYKKQTALINKLVNKTFNTAAEADTTALEQKIFSRFL